jgi:hypothetical protein
MRAAAALAAAALLAGCGAADEPAADPEPVEPGLLRFEHSVDTTGPMYIEGAIYHVTVEQDGEPIEDRTIEHDGTVTVELAPRGYTVGTYAQVCNGNCGSLSEPTDRCGAEVDLEAGASATATIVARPGGCTIEIS